jgi:tetratricopeptide (TPR) repeat protein
MKPKENHILFVFLIILTLCSFSLHAADFEVVYLDGSADLKAGSGWRPLYAGDLVSTGDQVKVYKGSLVELSGTGGSLMLSKEGTYNVASLTEDLERKNDIGLGSMLSSRMSTIFQGSSVKNRSTVAGVRGDVMDGDDAMTWMESGNQALIEEGVELLEEGEVDTAMQVFLDAYFSAMDEIESAAAAFYLAGIEDMQGNIAEAVDYIAGEELTLDHELYPDFVILKGKLLVDTLRYEDALELFETWDGRFAGKDQQQTVGLLHALTLASLNRNSEARSVLNETVAIDSTSETGKAAEKLKGRL